MTDALTTYAHIRNEGGQTSALEDALAHDLRTAYQQLHDAQTTAPITCNSKLAGGALVCTRTTPHTAPKGCTYQSTSGTPGAPKEEM